MPKFVKMKLGQGSALIEIAEAQQEIYRSDDSTDGVLDRLDKALDKVIQHQIVEHCKLLEGAFEQLKQRPIRPKKASAEFGLQCNAQGDIFIAKAGGQASFKVSFEWEF